jgi:hypothetical protein
LPGALADTGAAGATRSGTGFTTEALPTAGFAAGFASTTFGSTLGESFATAFATGLTGVLTAAVFATGVGVLAGVLAGALGAAFATTAFTGVLAAGALGATRFDLLGEADFIESLTDLAAGFAVFETGFAAEGLAAGLFGLAGMPLLGLAKGLANGLLALGDLADDLGTGLAALAAGFLAAGLTAAFGFGFAAARDIFLPTC